MTAIRSHEEPRTVLDFSNGKCSKNKIRQSLRGCHLTSLEENDDYEVTLYQNEIKVGMYSIVIQLPFDLEGPRKLKDFKDFEISIYDGADHKTSRVNLKKDPRFRSQYWVSLNFFGKLRVKHLIDIIAHCKRLDKLKAFL